MSSFGERFKGVKGKLFSIILLALVVFSGLAFVSRTQLAKISGEMQQLVANRVPTLKALGDMGAAQQAVSRWIWAAYVEKSPEKRKPRLESVHDAVNSFKDAMDEWKKVDHSQKNTDLFKSMESTWGDTRSYVEQIVVELEKFTPEGDKSAYEVNVEHVRSRIKTIEQNLKEIKNNVVEDVKKESSDAMSGAEQAIMLVTIIAGAGILVVLLLGFIIASGLANALVRVTKMIYASSTQVASASQQISSSSQQLAATSSEQASAIEETSASLQEMGGMVENNVRNAEQGLETVTSVISSTKQGNDSMVNLRSSMENILESNKKIEKLVKVIEEIGEKTAIIDEIVFQTKLLSFNASVEAERAGEHGRGFAVVAQEVGNLAQMSGKAALEISSIVKTSTKEAQEIATENRNKVEKGGKLVEDAAKILSDIQKRAEGVLEGSRHIVSASKEQAAGIKQITSAMDNINKATQETAASSEEAAGAGEELSGQARNLDSLVSQLTTIVSGASAQRGRGGFSSAGHPSKGEPGKVSEGTAEKKGPTIRTQAVPQALRRPVASNVVRLQPQKAKASVRPTLVLTSPASATHYNGLTK